MRLMLVLVEQIVFPLWVGLAQSIEDPDRATRVRKAELFPVNWSSLLGAPPLSSSPGKHRSLLPLRCLTQPAGGTGDSFVPIAITSDFPLPGTATISSSAPAPPPWECSHRENAVPRYGGKGRKEEA